MTATDHSPEALHLLRVDSPIGRLELVSNGDAIVSLSIESDGSLPLDSHGESPDPVLERAAAQLEEYFAGSRHDFDVPIALAGTAFQLAVWEQLVQLEWGEVLSYGEIGQATGRATAGRAVGGAIGANPVPILVPCHRVLGSDGTVTGYSAGEGIPTKTWLLEHEGIAHRVPRSLRPTLFDEVENALGDESGRRDDADSTSDSTEDSTQDSAAA